MSRDSIWGNRIIVIGLARKASPQAEGMAMTAVARMALPARTLVAARSRFA